MHVTLKDKKVAIQVGLSGVGLHYLTDMLDRGKSKEGPDVAAYLVKSGHLERDGFGFKITAKGEDAVAQARQRGWAR